MNTILHMFSRYFISWFLSGPSYAHVVFCFTPLRLLIMRSHVCIMTLPSAWHASGRWRTRRRWRGRRGEGWRAQAVPPTQMHRETRPPATAPLGQTPRVSAGYSPDLKKTSFMDLYFSELDLWIYRRCYRSVLCSSSFCKFTFCHFYVFYFCLSVSFSPTFIFSLM